MFYFLSELEQNVTVSCEWLKMDARYDYDLNLIGNEWDYAFKMENADISKKNWESFIPASTSTKSNGKL